MISSSVLKKAGDYLLAVLKERDTVYYSEFYDGNDAKWQSLRLGIGLSEDDADWYSAEALMDDAANLFAHVGFVEIKIREDKLADGEPNYEILLTEKGRAFIADGQQYEFPDLEMHI